MKKALIRTTKELILGLLGLDPDEHAITHVRTGENDTIELFIAFNPEGKWPDVAEGSDPPLATIVAGTTEAHLEEI
jgi:hypothetical protein